MSPAQRPNLPSLPGLETTSTYTRRRVLLMAGAGSLAAFLAACSSDSETPVTTDAATPDTAAPVDSAAPDSVAPDTAAATETTVAAAGDTTPAAPAAGGANAAKFGGGGGDGTLKIGFTAPLTGPLAGFGEANDFTLAAINGLLADGMMIGDKSYKVEIIVRDVQSNSDTAAAEAQKLITDDGVDLIVAMATPEMINPVADQCEANGVPCISTLAPWDPFFFGRGGDPAKGFDWTYHFFWGGSQMPDQFGELWNAVETNKKLALLAPNDPDGKALADAKLGFPAKATALGYEVIDGGRYNTGTPDFSAMIGQFKDAEVLVGIPIPPDFATFWKQAKQQGLNPKVATVAKALLFPAAVESLGDLGDNICTEIWWSPSHPFSSSLTGTKSSDLAAEYTSATKKQWTQFVGFVHALFEITLDSVARAGSTDKQALVDAIAATKLDTIVGPISFAQEGLPKNVCPTPLVGGQWQKTEGGEFPFDLVIVNNKFSPEIPTGGTQRPMA